MKEKGTPAIISCKGPKLYNLLSYICFPKVSERLMNDRSVDVFSKHLFQTIFGKALSFKFKIRK